MSDQTNGWGQSPENETYGPPPAFNRPGFGQSGFGPPPGQVPPQRHPGYGQPAFVQPSYSPPPQSSSNKTVWIILGVVGALVLLFVIGVAFFVSQVSSGLPDFTDTTQNQDPENGFAIPDGQRLLDQTGMVEVDDLAVLSFTVEQATTVQIDVSGQSGFDPVISLLNDQEREIASDDDGGPGLGSQIRTSLDAGDYTIEVRGFSGGDGPFRALVTQV